MAGFQLTLHGRIWVTPEGTIYLAELDQNLARAAFLLT
jgi:hypothetical protein